MQSRSKGPRGWKVVRAIGARYWAADRRPKRNIDLRLKSRKSVTTKYIQGRKAKKSKASRNVAETKSMLTWLGE
jgi:hypothetical protein